MCARCFCVQKDDVNECYTINCNEVLKNTSLDSTICNSYCKTPMYLKMVIDLLCVLIVGISIIIFHVFHSYKIMPTLSATFESPSDSVNINADLNKQKLFGVTIGNPEPYEIIIEDNLPVYTDAVKLSELE
ncbi:hypothetical protein HZS_4215 [Henneguya salminicola]|nr:hypothetical protein HZS_4215 [Henneguya salminicola]